MRAALVLTAFGVVTVLVGVWLVYPPAALILAGVGLASTGLRLVGWEEE